MTERDEKLPDLAQFYGTMDYLRHRIVPMGPGLLLTDGAVYVAEEAGAWWLMDLILLGMQEWLARGNGFATLKLTVADGKATLRVEDGNDNILAERAIEHTDFPEPGIDFFLDGRSGGEPVLMLPSEY